MRAAATRSIVALFLVVSLVVLAAPAAASEEVDYSPPRVYLVPEPLDQPTKSSGHGWSVPGLDALRSAIDWELRHVSALPGEVTSATPAPFIVDAVTALADWQDQRTHCTSVSTPPP